jgi:hypothetical protein
MRKLEIVEAAVMQMAIREEIDRSEEPRYDYRLHGVLLVASGRSCTVVSQLLGEDATTVGTRGRTKSLDERQWTRLARDLRLDPRRCGQAQHF